MNEADAKTKWCPFTLQRVTVMLDPSGGEQTIRNAEARQGNCNCIASACMAWRVTGVEYTGEQMIEKLPNGGGRIKPGTRPIGECGFAFLPKFNSEKL